MVMQGKHILAVVLVCVVTPVSLAAEPLSWLECVQATEHGNAQLVAAKAAVRAAEMTAKASASGFYPQLSGVASYSRGNGAISTAGTSSTLPTSTVRDTYSVGLQATQNLFNGFHDQATVNQNDAQTRVQVATYDATTASVSALLKTAYASLLLAQRSVVLQQEIIHRREENLRIVQLRFDSGGENKGSVLLSKANLNQAEYDALQAGDNIVVQQAALARVMGVNDEAGMTLSEEIPLAPLVDAPDFNQLVLNTPDHRQALATQQAAEAGVTIARSAFLPTVALNASTGKLGNQWYPDSDHWSVGATATMPLFNGGRDYYGTSSAQASLASARATLDDTDKQVHTKLKQTYMAYREAKQKLNVDESFREAAAKRAEIARSKYNNGLMTFEDWDLIESDLIAREKAVLQSQFNLVTAEAAWQQAQGVGVLP